MNFESFVKIIIICINVLMICCIPFYVRRYKNLQATVKLSENLRRQLKEDAKYWEAEYHKLFERYEHSQTTIRRLGNLNKALQSQAPAPKKRGRPS